MTFVKEFKAFVARGNVIDLAVAVVLGAAFSSIVTAIVNGIIMPIIGKIMPEGEWQTWAPGGIALGAVLGAIINFLVIAAVVFIVVVKVMGSMKKKKEVAAPTTKTCAECLEEIPLAAKRCRACSSPA